MDWKNGRNYTQTIFGRRYSVNFGFFFCMTLSCQVWALTRNKKGKGEKRRVDD